jgi:hypothetical protein
VLLAKPLMVTVEPPIVPLAIVATPDPFETRLELRVKETRVPVPLFTSGLALGKDVSLSIGTKPPTSSTRSTIRASIAAVVANLLSSPTQVSPDVISSTLLFS